MKLSFSKLFSSWRHWTDRLNGFAHDDRNSRRGRRRSPASRRLFLESLEDRTLLSGSPFGTGAPPIDYSALVGGSGTESADNIAVDSAGNTYVIGSSDSPTFPGTDTANAGQADAFVSKLSPTGELLWSTLLGGEGFDRGMGIALGSSGDIYITGFTGSTNFPGADPSDNLSGDAFISKLSSDGDLLWTKRFGSSDPDAGVGITVDSSDNAYIVGYLYSSSDSTTFPGTDQTAGVGQRIFVSKFNSDGELTWSSLLGGNAGGAGADIAVDASGGIYITGNTFGATFPGTNETSPGFEDAFVSKLNADGELLWSTRIGGTESDRGSGITLDASGNIYISGTTLSTTFPGTDQTMAGVNDAFVSKLNASGELLWSTLVGGSRGDNGADIAMDAFGNIYLTGTTTSSAFPGTDQTNAGDGDAFVAKLNADGELLGSTLLGGDLLDSGLALAVDSSGDIHIAGESRSSNFPGPNGTELASAGLVDAFVAKLVIQTETGNPAPVLTQLSQSSIVAGSGQFTLTVNGSSFIPDSKVQWNGTALATTYVSATQLTAVVPADLLAEAGTASITVVNPTPGGGTSEALTFTVTEETDNPAPVLTELSQSSIVAGSGQFILTVNGNNFISNSVVQWNGTALETTFVSDTQLTAMVPTGLLAEAGDYAVTVVSPAPGGGASQALTFTVTEAAENPVPTLTNLSQTSIAAGSGQLTLTINGSSFIPDSKVQWNGTALATTYVSATQLTAVVPATYLAQEGTAKVTVVNPVPGGGVSNALTITVTEAPPMNGPGEPGGSQTPVSTPAAPTTSEWDGLFTFYHYLCYQYLTELGLDPLSSFNWGAIFAQFNVNLGTMRNASPLVSLILFNHFLEQGGDPYSSAILSTSYTSQGGSFTPASGSPSERAVAYYETLGLPADELTDYYAYALGNGHPDDAIAALIAAQHGTQRV